MALEVELDKKKLEFTDDTSKTHAGQAKTLGSILNKKKKKKKNASY